MKAVLVSIQPYWVYLIIAKAMDWKIDKEKTIEVRKNLPKAENWDKVVKIYCSKDKRSFSKIPKEHQPLMEQFLGKVVGEFVCDTVVVDRTFGHDALFNAAACMTDTEVAAYSLNSEMYGWHISNLVIYDKPKPLSAYGAKHKCNLSKKCTEHGFLCAGYCKLTRPPQSWCYVEELEDGK